MTKAQEATVVMIHKMVRDALIEGRNREFKRWTANGYGGFAIVTFCVGDIDDAFKDDWNDEPGRDYGVCFVDEDGVVTYPALDGNAVVRKLFAGDIVDLCKGRAVLTVRGGNR